MKLELITEVKDGKLSTLQTRRIREFLGKINTGLVKILLQDQGRMRSREQTNYYWGCILEIFAEETGYTREEGHEIFKAKFLKEPDFKSDTGHLIPGRIKSTSELSTSESEKYHEAIRRFCSVELGIVIPEPNQAFFT